MNKILTTNKLLAGILLALIALTGLYALYNQAITTEGSTITGQDYYATSTGESTGNASILELKTTAGALGSVVITGAAAGWIELYDATTTNANFRDANQSTSSILIAHIPVSAAAQTQTFDATFNRGLIVYVEGTQPTTTITWR